MELRSKEKRICIIFKVWAGVSDISSGRRGRTIRAMSGSNV